MVVDGEVQAEKKVRALSDLSSGDALAAWKGSGGSPSDGDDDGSIDDDEVAMSMAQFKKQEARPKP